MSRLRRARASQAHAGLAAGLQAAAGRLLLAALACGLTGAAAARPVDPVQLAQEKQCFQCHAVDRDAIGPGFRKIGAIYRGMNRPQARLVEMMRMGSDAHLGPMSGAARMPDSSERPLLSDAQARQLARWILALRP